MMEEGTAIHIAIHNNLAHGVPQSLAVRWLRPLSAGCLQTEDLGSYMNQFTAERYHQELCIRYVSGLRNQKLFPFSNLPIACNHPNLCVPHSCPNHSRDVVSWAGARVWNNLRMARDPILPGTPQLGPSAHATDMRYGVLLLLCGGRIRASIRPYTQYVVAPIIVCCA